MSKYFLLNYKYVKNISELRPKFRSQHLNYVKKFESPTSPQQLLLGGAMNPIEHGAFLLFKAANPELVQKFALDDPYVKEKLLDRFTVNEWTVVVGNLCDPNMKLT